MRTGRPTKLNTEFLKAAKEIIEDKNAFYLTDDDLLTLINEKLPTDNQISQRTFRRWKAKETVNPKAPVGGYEGTLYNLLFKARISQKLYLFKRILSDANCRKWAWILERKFDEWNLRKLTNDHEIRKRVYWWKNH